MPVWRGSRGIERDAWWGDRQGGRRRGGSGRTMGCYPTRPTGSRTSVEVVEVCRDLQ